MGRTGLAVLGLGLVLSAGLVAFDRVTVPALRRQAELDQAVRASALAVRLDNHLSEAQQVARTLAVLAAHLRSLPEAETLLTRVLLSTPAEYVHGAGVWFEPGALEPGRRYAGPYARRPRGGGPGVEITYEWSTPDYDYPSRAWYRAGLAAGATPAFTEPYFDVDFVYRTVALPVRDAAGGGPPRGVVTVDVTLPLLRRLVAQANTSPHEVLYAVTPEGRLFAHPDEAELLAWARARGQAADNLSDLRLEDLRAHEREQGLDRARHTHAAAVTGTGWRVFVATERARLYAEARRARVGSVAVGGMLWLLLGALGLALQRTRHARRLQATLDARERTRRLLEESEARLRQVLDSALDAVVAVDGAGRVVAWNGCAGELTGWPPEEALGRSALELLVPEAEREAVAAALAEALGQPAWRRRVEAEVLRRDGRRVAVEASLVVVGAAGGAERTLYAFAQDVSERRHQDAERLRLLGELRQRTGELQGVVDSLPQGVFVADATGRITLLNRAAVRMMGRRAPQAQQLTPDLPRAQGILLPDGSPAPLERLPLYRALRGERVEGVELLAAPPAGEPGPRRVVRTSAAPIYDPQGRVVGATAVSSDVTAETEAARARDVLVAAAAEALATALDVLRDRSEFAGEPITQLERTLRALEALRTRPGG